MYRWLQDDGLPGGFQVCCLSCNDSEGTGERCTLAHIDGKKRCCACNEIKLPEKDSALTEPPVTGTLAPEGARRRSQSNEEDREMPKSDMTGTEGEITAIYRSGVRHAEV